MFRTLSGLIVLGATMFAVVTGSAQVKKGPELDAAATVAAMKKLFAKEMSFEVKENGVIAIEKFDPSSSLPRVFQFAAADDKLLARFPRSDAAIGLDLSRAKGG